jgi:uncharacterized protein YbjT (DUF2867 family)
LHTVTGAFSYTGRAIAEVLLRRGHDVRTLSRRPEPADPLANRVERAPLDFSNEAALRDRLRGTRVLYNTYWIRFPHGGSTYERAIANTCSLLAAAAAVGVERVVHLSVTNADARSPLPYFRGKAVLEHDVATCGLGYAIVRPTLVFGRGDILVNNIAWTLRRFPIFLMPGRGSYEVQPVSVEDVARIAVDAGEADEDVIVDAAGPETYTYDGLVRLVARAVGSRARIVHVPPTAALLAARVVGIAHRDVMLTREELRGLSAGLLTSRHRPAGSNSFRRWLGLRHDELGRAYVSELARNFRPYRPL